MKIWSCKIGESAATPNQADGPMREAVAEAYERMTGEAPTFIFSGWGAALTEPERAVVENRLPEPQTAEQPSASPAALEAELIAALRWAIDEAHAQKLAGISGPLSRILARAQGEQA